MDPIKMADHNFTFRGEHQDPESGRTINEGVGDLSCRREGGAITSHWQPDQAEREMLARGGVVELTVWAPGFSPTSIGVKEPDPAPVEQEAPSGE